MPRVQLKTTTAQQAGSRSILYSLMAAGFAAPTQEFWKGSQGTRFFSQIREAASGLPFTIDVEATLQEGSSLLYDDLVSAHIDLFVTGGSDGSPVPLYEGHYGGGLLRDMEEVMRLYHHFGLSYQGGFRPDHLSTELEFMHALTFREASAIEARRQPLIYRRAEKEFLQYHLADLVFRVAKGLRGRSAPFYPALAQFVATFVEKEQAHIADRLKDPGPGGGSNRGREK